MKREWSIEIGLIEPSYLGPRRDRNAYRAGPGGAIIRDMAGRRSQHAIGISHDQHGMIEGLYRYIKGEVPLTETFIRQLHQKLTASQPTTEVIDALGRRIDVDLVNGQYKRLPNNPRRPEGSMQAYCLRERVAEEMGRLLGAARELNAQQALPEVFTAWLHYAFTHIHLFQDGNERVGRALAMLVFLRAGLFPLIVRDEQRTAYIDALEAADSRNLAPLIKLFARQQHDAILQALGLVQLVARGDRLQQQLATALQKRLAKVSEERQRLDHLSEALVRAREESFARWHGELQSLLDAQAPQGATWQARIFVVANGAENDHWFRQQIIQVANNSRWHYFVKLDALRALARLSLRTDLEFLHGYCAGMGVRAVSALIYSRPLVRSRTCLTALATRGELTPAQPAILKPVLCNYGEMENSLLPRSATWIEGACEIARGEWLRMLRKY